MKVRVWVYSFINGVGFESTETGYSGSRNIRVFNKSFMVNAIRDAVFQHLYKRNPRNARNLVLLGGVSGDRMFEENKIEYKVLDYNINYVEKTSVIHYKKTKRKKVVERDSRGRFKKFYEYQDFDLDEVNHKSFISEEELLNDEEE